MYIDLEWLFFVLLPDTSVPLHKHKWRHLSCAKRRDLIFSVDLRPKYPADHGARCGGKDLSLSLSLRHSEILDRVSLVTVHCALVPHLLRTLMRLEAPGNLKKACSQICVGLD